MRRFYFPSEISFHVFMFFFLAGAAILDADGNEIGNVLRFFKHFSSISSLLYVSWCYMFLGKNFVCCVTLIRQAGKYA